MPATGPAAVFGTISGMAPRARIAAVQGALVDQDASTRRAATTPDLVAAIDQAVADGVDVINYSISGTQTNFADPVEISFLFAADAGIFVAAVGRQQRPDRVARSRTPARGSRPSRPARTTATARARSRSATARPTTAPRSRRRSVRRRSSTPPRRRRRRRRPRSARASASPPATTAATAVLDPAKVAGKIVVCERGVNARVNKSLAVQEAGGVGMILVNTTTNSLNADFHFVPTVHLPGDDRAAVKAYAATAGATATINQATIVFNAPAPFTAAFSSRGPLAAGGGDLLKPDVIAPGQDILAAVAPPANQRLSTSTSCSGTSMSAPHVAGLAALLKDLHPSWSPMAIKSALMTTGYGRPRRRRTPNPSVIFRQGAGHVAAQRRGRSRASSTTQASTTGWRSSAGRRPAVNPASCTALVNGGLLDRRRATSTSASIAIGDLAGVADRHPHGDQRRQHGGDLHARRSPASPGSARSSAQARSRSRPARAPRSPSQFTRDDRAP